jgi:GH15 family glucan-1,4-alpha-glucosidase
MPEHSNYPSTSDHAFLSDCHSAPLVLREGSLDWLCMPRFDSGSGFGRLLDWKRGGLCSIFPNSMPSMRAPTEDDRRAERQATIRRAIEAAQDLKWGRLSAGIAGA